MALALPLTLPVDPRSPSPQECPPVTSAITLNVHPSRAELHEELHSRPSPLVETPCTISHIAVQIGAEERAAERAYLGELCTRFDVNPPPDGASCLYQTFGGFELRWERHTEFSTYTFIHRVLGDPLRQAGALRRVTTALHLAFSCAEGPLDPAELDRYFEKQPLRGGVVRQGTAYLYSSFRLHSDGFGRIVLQARDLTPLQAGRLVQRVLEVETYRLMALLALPVARKITPEVRAMERELARITQDLTHAEKETDQHALLDELSNLAARVESHRSDTTYRFAATNAYYDLVEERIRELGEEKIPGLQSIRVFIERRLAPGIRTCNAVRDRLEGLSGRISQASELLRARVELSIQGQNRELLTSMNRRSEVQLRLQQAVEGLSVVAMTYYLMGLLGYLYEGLAWTGLALDKKIGFAIAVPVVMLAVWKVIHGVRRRIEQP
ncbi:MAG: DUF3422 domain-containing protein [Deltaproteobacteria bacterium]|nr:DUF3422 domain-containing protein [Deltaproteobacteria bacterium]